MVKEFVTERLKLIDIHPDKAKSIAKEYGLKEDEVELIRKGRVSNEPVIDRDARTVINYISTDAIDRDNEVIEHRGVVLDDYKENPIVPWAHDYRALPIGKNLWIKPDKKGLVAKTFFLRHPFAEQVFDLYTEDIAKTGPALKAWSVGFIPLKWKDAKPDEKVAEDERPVGARRTYKKWLLLEYSAVPVPSNPEALTLMVEKGLIKDDKLKKDIEEFIVEIKKEDKGTTKLKQATIKGLNKLEEKGYISPQQFEDIVLGKVDISEYETGTTRISIDGRDLFFNENGKLDGAGSCVNDQPDEGKEVILKPEEDDDSIRLPVKGEEGKHKDHKIRWITVSEEKGIKGLYCIDCKKIITYIFDKKKGWTMVKAKKWMKDHGKDVHIEETVNALTGKLGLYIIYDGKDFVEDLGIKEEEIKEKPKTEDPIKWIKELTDEVKALKEGRVLSGKNLKLVKDCKEQIDLVGELLDKLIVASEPPKEESILPLIEDSKGKENITDVNSLTKDDMPIIVEEVLKGLKAGVASQHKEIQKLFDNKRGKVS